MYLHRQIFRSLKTTSKNSVALSRIVRFYNLKARPTMEKDGRPGPPAPFPGRHRSFAKKANSQQSLQVRVLPHLDPRASVLNLTQGYNPSQLLQGRGRWQQIRQIRAISAQALAPQLPYARRQQVFIWCRNSAIGLSQILAPSATSAHLPPGNHQAFLGRSRTSNSSAHNPAKTQSRQLQFTAGHVAASNHHPGRGGTQSAATAAHKTAGQGRDPKFGSWDH